MEGVFLAIIWSIGIAFVVFAFLLTRETSKIFRILYECEKGLRDD